MNQHETNLAEPIVQRLDMPSVPMVDNKDPSRFVNREFSWLQFNWRVLEEARNDRQPLLERLRFLSISAANLDEFFMVRVAGLAGQVREEVTERSLDGLSAAAQLELVSDEIGRLQTEQQIVLSELREDLADEGIEIVRAEALTPDERDWLEDKFLDDIFPVLTPMSIDPAHPFPFIPNLGFSTALQLSNPATRKKMNALVRFPVALNRFVQIPCEPPAARFISLEDVVSLFIGKLYPGYQIKGQDRKSVV